MQLIDYLPIYGKSAEMAGMQDGIQEALDALWGAAFALGEQIRVNTATTGIDLWEEMLGLNPPGENDTYAARRERIVAKLRGTGTSTVAMIQSTVESFGTGAVEIEEHNNESYFSIIFVSIKGQPKQLDALKAAVERIKPAHLDVEYTFLYTTHAELATYTHAELSAYTHKELQTLKTKSAAAKRGGA